VLAYPDSNTPPFMRSFEIEFNPARGLVLSHWDEKVVFVLGSDPDEVVGAIANFAESDRSAYSINQLAKVVSQRSRNEVAELKGREEARQAIDAIVRRQIEAALSNLDRIPAGQSGKAEALAEIDILINLLRTVSQ